MTAFFWIRRRRHCCREKPARHRPRLFADGVRTNTFAELGGRSWIAAWEDWIADLDRSLSSRGVPLIPNVGSLVTTWDNSDYSLSAGAFCEGFLDPDSARKTG
jgi:hypothetical protein